MKKISIIIMGLLLVACTAKTPIKKGEATSTNDKEEVASVKVELKGDKIEKINIDETDGKTSKKALGSKYNMKQASMIAKEWDEQIIFLESYIKDNGIDSIKLASDGKAANDDVKSGCTIRIEGFIDLSKQAMKNAK